VDSQNLYNYTIVRQFAVMSVVWGIIGIIIGIWLAAELAFPVLNLGLPWTSFGRLRPLHTHLVLFGFAGNALFATSYYVAQRTCRTRLFGNSLATFTFWGWQGVLFLGLLTLPLGMTSGKEYAELEWPIDLLFIVVWCVYAIVFFGTLARRRTPYIYVANWFYGAYILAVIILYAANNAALPVSFWPLKSYSFYPGAVDAMVAWWYGHNLVGSFLTIAFLGALYYFLPTRAERPLYSYRLAAVHFWAMIMLTMWSGPQHLLYTALPDWTQSLGVLFATLLFIPFSGALINGFMTVGNDWYKVRTDPILRFIVVALIFYSLASFSGPIMALRTVNTATHYTNWTVTHAHTGTLGWIGFLVIGAIYSLMPRLFNREQMYSTRLINLHFWLATCGIVLYLVSMGSAGWIESQMLRALNDDGTLTYRFIDVVTEIRPFYLIRIGAGALYLLGLILMAYNISRTLRLYFNELYSPQPTTVTNRELPELAEDHHDHPEHDGKNHHSSAESHHHTTDHIHH